MYCHDCMIETSMRGPFANGVPCTHGRSREDDASYDDELNVWRERTAVNGGQDERNDDDA